MNEIGIYAIMDSKAEAFMQPFFAQTPGLAQRMCEGTVNDPNSQLNRYPEDFALWRIGSFDDRTGQVTGDTPTLLVQAFQLLRKEE